MPTTEINPEPPARTPRPRRWRRRLAWLLAFVVGALVAGELVARFYFGLGDPPLMMADPQIEYLYKPSQTVRRFGHVIHYNQYSMRSPDFPAHKSDPSEFRVLVVGDSVVNGGAVNTDADVATAILARMLPEDLRRPVVVGNISAGSWGPPNELAYLRRFGTFDADVIVLVFSSHDAADVPTFEPTVGVRDDFPDRRPVSALAEGVHRYLPRVWWRLTHRAEMNAAATNSAPAAAATMPAADVEAATRAIAEMIDLARAAGATMIVAQHLEAGELNGHAQPGQQIIADLARAKGIEPLQLGDAFGQAMRNGIPVYDGYIHPSRAGQQLMADVLLPEIERAAHAREHPQTRPAE
jgi:lysophospholipase L1-like esterase